MDLSYTLPGKQVSRLLCAMTRRSFFSCFVTRTLAPKRLSTEDDWKSALTEVFAHVGWECPRIWTRWRVLADLYFDRVSQIRMDAWARGRTVLVG